MKNIKLILQYDGTLYHGFQIQPEVSTIQGMLQKTVCDLFNEEIKVYGCSRTDAGVHALRYCAGFNFNNPIPADKIALVMNNKLPSDIRVLSSELADDDFHPRFSTKSKTYQYTINTDSDAGVFTRCYEWQLKKKLDIGLMKEAAEYIVGTHDFCSFMTAGSEMESTVRTVYSLEILDENPIVKIRINADGYLYNMVRIITGTLVFVGLGKIRPGDVGEIIEKKDRNFAGPTAPPQGLALYEIYY